MSAEGCLIIRLKKSSTNRTGLQVELVFQITQHTRDEQLLLSFIKYFDCGRYRQRKGGLAGDFIVSRLSDLTDKIIPFFEIYPIKHQKKADFELFKNHILLFYFYIINYKTMSAPLLKTKAGLL